MDYPNFIYSQEQVLRASKQLSQELIWTDETNIEIREIFKIANNWRDSHAYPMHRIRRQLIGKIKSNNIKGVTAARLKRMHSIRKKLKNSVVKLHKMQDLAGCRAILPTIEDVDKLVSCIKTEFLHKFEKENDYITNIKSSGYRSYHLVYSYLSEDNTAIHNGRKIELQIRTQLQHSWATAVEAIGLYRGEDMKGGEGDLEWNELFKLVSFEFAIEENRFYDNGSQDRLIRVSRIIELEVKLKSINVLETLRQGVNYLDECVRDIRSNAQYFLLTYNHVERTIKVEEQDIATNGINQYDLAEQFENKTGNTNINTVLVEADKIEGLIQAYPNYFGDVDLFNQKLYQIVYGKIALDYNLIPQGKVPPKPKVYPDLSWFKNKKLWVEPKNKNSK